MARRPKTGSAAWKKSLQRDLGRLVRKYRLPGGILATPSDRSPSLFWVIASVNPHVFAVLSEFMEVLREAACAPDGQARVQAVIHREAEKVRHGDPGDN